MQNYIITGGEGFIGSKIVKKVKGQPFDIKSGLDILNTDKLKEAVGDKAGIFHCAAKISVPESIEKPEEYYKNNVEGTRSVLEVADITNSKIVFSSSAAVYGEYSEPIEESFVLNPKSPYAENKRDGENILKNAKNPAIALRYFNVYGPGQSSEYSGVITKFIINALCGSSLVIQGDGSQARDFIFVDDVVNANVLAMDYDNKAFEIFNIGGGREISILELAEKIINLAKSRSKIIYSMPRAGDIMYSKADISKAKNLLGFSPTVSLEDGLKKTIEYYKNAVC